MNQSESSPSGMRFLVVPAFACLPILFFLGSLFSASGAGTDGANAAAGFVLLPLLLLSAAFAAFVSLISLACWFGQKVDSGSPCTSKQEGQLPR